MFLYNITIFKMILLYCKEKRRHRKRCRRKERSKDFVRAVPSPACSIQWGNFAAKSALKYQPDISVTIWILNKNKKSRIEKRPDGDVTFRDRTGKILFMDLRQMGHPYEKKYIEFTYYASEISSKKSLEKFVLFSLF